MPDKPPTLASLFAKQRRREQWFLAGFCIFLLAAFGCLMWWALSLPPDPVIKKLGKIGDCEVARIYQSALVVVCPQGVAIR
jgi:hypothetical protein